jgi:hypothetical protein
MRRLIVLTALALATSANAATLNKCIDAKGKVTYSNLPCHNARVARAVEIDPAPVPDPARAKPARMQPAPPPVPKPAASVDSAIRFETQRTSGKPAPHASSRQCDALTDKLGRVFDQMDQARRKGYTQKQMDAWNQEVKDLERKKQQSSCF